VLLDKLFTKLTSVETTDGIASTSLRDTLLSAATITLVETLEMEDIVSGVLIQTLEFVLETSTVLDLNTATLLLIAVMSTFSAVLSIHVVELKDFVPQSALNKLKNLFMILDLE